jgi:hypothetical protein
MKLRVLWLFAALLFSGSARAQFDIEKSDAPKDVIVRTTRKGSLYKTPSARAEVVREFIEDTRYTALRLSPAKTWVEVQNEQGRGWVPRNWVAPIAPGELALAAPDAIEIGEGPDGEGVVGGDEALGESPDTSSPDPESELEAFDAKSNKYFSTRKGRFFETPSPNAVRFGLIEDGDELRISQYSKQRRWAKVRLDITGEEGWWPAAWIKTERDDRLGKAGRFNVELHMAFGTEGHFTGFGGGLFFNFAPLGFNDRPRDRLELGVIGDYWLGEQIISEVGVTTQSADISYKSMAAVGRYVGSVVSGHLNGYLEMGLSLHLANITTDITDPVILAEFEAKETSYGLHLGVLGSYSFYDWLLGFGGVRAHISGAPVIMVLGGVGFRF